MGKMKELDIEQQIIDKGLTGVRITPKHIDDIIQTADYYVFPGTTLTICVLALENGFRVTGESSSVTTSNFDSDIGKEVAFNNARDKIWQLEGYLLKQRIYESRQDKEIINDRG